MEQIEYMNLWIKEYQSFHLNAFSTNHEWIVLTVVLGLVRFISIGKYRNICWLNCIRVVPPSCKYMGVFGDPYLADKMQWSSTHEYFFPYYLSLIPVLPFPVNNAVIWTPQCGSKPTTLWNASCSQMHFPFCVLKIPH